MPVMPATLSLLAWLLGASHIVARYTGHRQLAFWLKPLPIFLFMALALLASPPLSTTYRVLILLGLLFSATGDVLLALPQDRFILGLASFLVAHLCYIAAFSSRGAFHLTWWVLAIGVLYGAIMLAVLWPAVTGPLRIPVAAYMLVILVMGWLAVEQWLATRDTGALLAMIGALFFIASDSLLALNRFRAPFAAADAAVMLTYYAAQWLIALSVQK